MPSWSLPQLSLRPTHGEATINILFFSFLFCFILVVLGIELRASRCTTPPVVLLLVCFFDRVLPYCQGQPQTTSQIAWITGVYHHSRPYHLLQMGKPELAKVRQLAHHSY